MGQKADCHQSEKRTETDGFPEVTRSDNNFIPSPRVEREFSPQLLVSPEALIAFNTNYLLLEASVVKRNTNLPVGKERP